MKEIILTKVGFVLVLVFILWGLSALENKKCVSAYANYQPSWGFFSGCRIMWDGKLTPVDIVREIK